MRKYLVCFFILIGALSVSAQTVRCVTMESLAQRAAQNPELMNGINDAAAIIMHSLDQNDRAGDPVYYIPVVVHIVYLAELTKINLDDFTSGIYYVQLNADGLQTVKKFVKN